MSRVRLLPLAFLLWSAHFAASAQDGTLDLSFNVGTGLNNQIWAMALQADDKVLIGGIFTSYNGTPCNTLARLNIDGSLDGTFNIGTGPNGYVSALAVQPDGKILLSGQFSSFNGTGVLQITRVNPNGSLDPTFVPDVPSLPACSKIQLQPDGKILFLEEMGSMLSRLNANGSSDMSIQPSPLQLNNVIEDFDLQPNGKILVGGWFTMHNGTAREKTTRINPDFTLDPTYAPASVDGLVYTLAHQADGKVLIGGSFDNVGGVPRPGVARLNYGGGLDAGFDTDTIGGDGVTMLLPQPDGKILMGVQFPFMGPPVFLPEPYFHRLNANGSVDTGFQLGTGPNGFPQAMVIQPDGKILLGGSFTAYNGTNRLRLARINGTARVRVKLMLEGPYSGGSMSDALRTLPSFPLNEPFTSRGYSETGYAPGATIAPSTLTTTGNNAIVDWLIVEMRPAATPNVVAGSRAVLLQRDGDVVDLDGVSTVGFGGLAHGNYCVVVKPRNHLPVMLSPSTPFAYGTSTATVDFTLPGTQVYDADARKNVGSVMLLQTGDATFNEELMYVGLGNDRDPILTRIGGSTPTATVSGYYPEDVNMDGVVKYVGANNDRDPILLNVGGSTPTAARNAVLP